VPERVGEITPEQIAAEAADWLDHPQRLAGMQDDLRSLRGQPGAVARLAGLITELLPGAPPALGADTASPLPALAMPLRQPDALAGDGAQEDRSQQERRGDGAGKRWPGREPGGR